MKTKINTKECNLNGINRIILFMLFVSTLLYTATIIIPKHQHIHAFLSSFASHHVFIAIFILTCILTFVIKFITEFYSTDSLTQAGINTYAYYKPTALKGRWKQRLAKFRYKSIINNTSKNQEVISEDVLTDPNEKSKRYRDLLNAMSLGNNFKHKVKIHLITKDKLNVLETTVWYANTTHVTLKGGMVIPVKNIIKVEY